MSSSSHIKINKLQALRCIRLSTFKLCSLTCAGCTFFHVCVKHFLFFISFLILSHFLLYCKILKISPHVQYKCHNKLYKLQVRGKYLFANWSYAILCTDAYSLRLRHWATQHNRNTQTELASLITRCFLTQFPY